jgi:hypothetical protein
VSKDVNKTKRGSASVTTVPLEDLAINYHDKFLIQYDAEFVLLTQI